LGSKATVANAFLHIFGFQNAFCVNILVLYAQYKWLCVVDLSSGKKFNISVVNQLTPMHRACNGVTNTYVEYL